VSWSWCGRRDKWKACMSGSTIPASEIVDSASEGASTILEKAVSNVLSLDIYRVSCNADSAAQGCSGVVSFLSPTNGTLIHRRHFDSPNTLF
jgi:hypothetical protein